MILINIRSSKEKIAGKCNTFWKADFIYAYALDMEKYFNKNGMQENGVYVCVGERERESTQGSLFGEIAIWIVFWMIYRIWAHTIRLV